MQKPHEIIDGIGLAESVRVVGVCPCCGEMKIVFNDERGDPFAVAAMEPKEAIVIATTLLEFARMAVAAELGNDLEAMEPVGSA